MAPRVGFQTGFVWARNSEQQFIANLKAFAEHFPAALAAAQTEEAQILLEDMRLLAPLGETGELRASGRLVTGEEDGAQYVRIRFGGADVGVPYGVVQHEALDYKHATGQAWYVAQVLNDANDYFLHRLARRLGWTR